MLCLFFILSRYISILSGAIVRLTVSNNYWELNTSSAMYEKRDFHDFQFDVYSNTVGSIFQFLYCLMMSLNKVLGDLATTT